MTSPDSPMPTEDGLNGPATVRDAARGLSLGLIVGVVLGATTGDLEWIGLGLAFGPGVGLSLRAVLRAARSDREQVR